MKPRLFSNNTLIILKYLSIIIIIFSLFVSSLRPNTREGYKMMIELENPISKSDLYVVLTECVNNIIAHETVLSTLDNSYKADTIKVNTSISDMQNIQNILKIIKKQDIQIHKMLPNYLLNQDLDKLMNGTLFTDTAKQLEQKSKYPENPLECDPAAIKRAILGYQKAIEFYPGTDDDSKSKRMLYSNSISMLMSKLIELQASKPSPGNTKCLPPLLPSEAEGIMDGKYANALAKIVKSQDLAIESIKTQVQMEITQFYSAPIETGKPPSSPLDDIIV